MQKNPAYATHNKDFAVIKMSFAVCQLHTANFLSAVVVHRMLDKKKHTYKNIDHGQKRSQNNAGKDK